jgi:hypothetical protein
VERLHSSILSGCSAAAVSVERLANRGLAETTGRELKDFRQTYVKSRIPGLAGPGRSPVISSKLPPTACFWTYSAHSAERRAPRAVNLGASRRFTALSRQVS